MTPGHPRQAPWCGKGQLARNNEQATGFRGAVSGFPAVSVVAGDVSVLRLPSALRTNAALPDRKFAAIEVAAFTESMGTIESFAAQLATRLQPGGTLVLDLDNECATRQLRMLVEGRPGSFEPAGSIVDPSRPLPLRRALQALDAAGFHVEDVVRVDAAAGQLHADFAEAMFAQGFLPVAWVEGPPPSRFWITCSLRTSLAGSVLIGPGEPGLQQRTEACVRAFLPADWEVLCADGGTEAEGFTRSVADARGDLVWFLRAGSTASAQLFEELTLNATLGAAAPGRSGERQCPGDLSGTMLPRLSVLLAGPVPTRDNTQIALEEYCMRLEVLTTEAALVDGVFTSPKPPLEQPATFAREAREMLAVWEPVQKANVRPAEIAKTDVEAPPWQGREPRISLCMIARDEERFLAECLKRAAPLADEILVVDTGSKDRTVAIAESFGAKVLHRAWDDDFATPRNVGIAAATGDWILVLDADEFLQEGSVERIRELVRDPAAAGYLMKFTNICPGQKSVGVMMVRLFRKLPGVVYENVIHEQVSPTLVRFGAEHGLALASCDVEVDHHGYSDEVVGSRNKNERNERLFKKQLAANADDIYCLYKYGDFLRRLAGREADSIALLDRCLHLIRTGAPSLPRNLPYSGEVAALCALERARRGDMHAALAIIDEALRRFIPTPNLHYIAASLLTATHQPDAAIAHYRRCLAYRGQTLVVPIQEGITGHVSLLGIAQALWQKGDIVGSRRLAQRAIELAPDFELGHMVLSKLQLAAGDAAAALQTLTTYLREKPDSAGACQQTTLILQRLGCVVEAQKMGRRAIDLLTKNGATDEAARMERILAAV
ncbi:MAG: glycosyltransferase [Planctomycetota bacterium]